MPLTTPSSIFDFSIFLMFLKAAVLILLGFYVIFALLVIRQTDLMSKTLITPVSPVIKGIAILHMGAAVALIVLAWGIL